jgi:uridine phosphorylase
VGIFGLLIIKVCSRVNINKGIGRNSHSVDLEERPGLEVVVVVGHEGGVVVSAVLDVEDLLFTSAVLEARGHLPESDVVSVDAVINAGLFAAEIVDGVFLEEGTEFVMDFSFLDEVLLD